ncbi:MAG TPA: toll/interleukin-1 receptor domain-containing protein [Sphingomicrobium sp.]|nr:toll/interleukin-1 receptor domain-containing protein [Sphingomicrobium sp.]
MADVFISYARANTGVARLLAQRLRSSGHSVWFDEEIPANRAYADVISEKLDQAKAVIVLWSAQAAASHWVRSEANRSREKGTLVQVRLDAARLPMPFDQIQCLDFHGWRGDTSSTNWQRLAATVGELVGAEHQESRPLASPSVGKLGAEVSRRRIIGGGVVVAAAAAVGIGWRQMAVPDAPPEAEILLQKASAIMQDARPEEQAQALAYLLEATRVAPQFAQAWGFLAVSYALRKFQVPKNARAGEEVRCRSAARTALDLDPNEPFANCALVLLAPPYRNWLRLERLGRQLARRFPAVPMPNHIFSDLLGDVGRWREAVEAQSKIDRKRFLIPLSERAIIQTLWSAGDIQGAESLLARAAERWPLHHAIWNLRISFLTFSGRPDEAIQLLENRSAQPPDYPGELIHSSLLTAKAMAGSADRESAIRANLEMLAGPPADVLTYLNRKISAAQWVAQRCAALGDADTAFAILDGYYFGRGRWAKVQPPAGDEDRTTANLFEPPMSVAWNDPRFAKLVEEIGLERYWRQTSTQPDYRRPA